MKSMQMEIGECFESVNDALRAVVMALGGFKKVGAMLRIDLPIGQAEAWVRHCVSDERREKFSPEQVVLLLRKAREIGFHAGMDFIAMDTGYKAQPVDQERQVQSLEQSISAQREHLNAQVANLARLRERSQP